MGREFAGTRHNVGFMVVEALADRHGGVFAHLHSEQLDLHELFGHVKVLAPQVE